jgi:hypothetical protein
MGKNAAMPSRCAWWRTGPARGTGSAGGPYLSERQWATIREDYSADGSAWSCFPHEHARSRAYRWGEDGLLGICDRERRLCFALALWNGRDPILKERLFGLSGLEGNHGEDCKECYFYLDATPTHSYMKALYKYPHAAFPVTARTAVSPTTRTGTGRGLGASHQTGWTALVTRLLEMVPAACPPARQEVAV